MNIDKNKLASLANMSDSDFAQIIKKAILMSGGSEAQANSAMTAAPLIKAKLKSAGEQDINRMVALLGEKNVADILDGKDGDKKS